MNRLHRLASQVHTSSPRSSSSSFGFYGSRYLRPGSSSPSALSPDLDNRSNLNHHHSKALSPDLTSSTKNTPSTLTSMKMMTTATSSTIDSGLSSLWTDELKINIFENDTLHIELNRPKALNSLSLDIITCLHAYFKKEVITKSQKTKCILLTGADKAFCAGGDIVSIMKIPENITRFFQLEYNTDNFTSQFTIPYVAVWQGYVMGGGVGLSIHGSYRIATDTTIFSMPEAGIGFFPDVGAVHFLTNPTGLQNENMMSCRDTKKCPASYNGLPLYLGLLGARLKAGDVMKAGLATHFIPSSKLNDFVNEIQQTDMGSTKEAAFKSVEKIISKYCDSPPPPSLLTDDNVEKISKYFGNDKLPLKEIISNLENDSKNDDFCVKALKELKRGCPTSWAVWYEYLKRNKQKKYSLSEALAQDFLLTQSMMIHENNFREGVRALLIEKDKNPKWCPPILNDITEEKINEMFECSRGISMGNFVPSEI